MHNIIKQQFFKQFLFILTFTFIAMASMSYFLYNHTIEDFKERQRIVKDTIFASFVEVAKFDKTNESFYKQKYGSSRNATLKQILSTLKHLKLENLDIVIGTLNDDIIRVHSYDFEEKNLKSMSIIVGSKLAIPMQRSFKTKSSGFIVEQDYENDTVLAKYDYIPDLEIGIVVKSKISLIEHYLFTLVFLLIIVALILITFIYFLLKVTQKPIQDSLVKSEEKFKNIFDNSSDGIVIHDLEGTILEVNSIKATRLGYSSEELIGKNVSFLDTAAYGSKIDKKIKNILENKHSIFESEHICKNGSIIPVEIHAKLIEYNNETAILSVVRDITERKKAEKELILAKEDAEAANEAKSLFLSNMSHEIRTPLNGIIGLTQLTLDSELDTQQKYYLNRVKISSHSLLHIINDILDYSKIQAGKLTLLNEPFDLEQILDNLSGLFGFTAEKKGIELFFNINKSVPPTLIGDKLRFTQILINLIGNAIKFTDSGEIILEMNVLHIDGNQCELEIMVKDTGIGIEKEEQEELFKNFTQVDNSYKRKYEGTGLGLAISKELVELMQGEISIQSVYGEGTTLRFNVKLEIEEYSLQNINRGDSVLVVDDSETSRNIIFEILNSIGMKVDLCEDGLKALEKIEYSLQNKKLYDFILLDWKMPKLSGVHTAKRIDELYKQFEVKHESIVVMVTAYSKDELLDEFKEHNIKPTNVLLKPVTASTLYDTLILGKQKSHPNAQDAIYTYDYRLTAIKGANILLVEDNTINQDVANAYLEKMKVNVTVANNGLEALELVQKNLYDIILMDLQMPVMDGIEATKEIKKLKDKHTIPIIAMTAAAMEKDRENSKLAGMQAHIIKPIEFEELKEVLLKFIQHDISNRVFKIKNSKPENKSIHFSNQIDGVNIDKLLEKLDNDTNLAYKLLLNFVKQYEDCEKIFDLLEVQSDEFIKYLHSLKGVSGNLMINDVYALSRTIYESEDLDEKRRLTQTLSTKLTSVVNNIKRSISTINRTNSAIQIPKDQLINILDEFIIKLDSTFILSFEEMQNLINQLEYIIEKPKLKILQEYFDNLEYEKVKEQLNIIKETLI